MYSSIGTVIQVAGEKGQTQQGPEAIIGDKAKNVDEAEPQRKSIGDKYTNKKSMFKAKPIVAKPKAKTNFTSYPLM